MKSHCKILRRLELSDSELGDLLLNAKSDQLGILHIIVFTVCRSRCAIQSDSKSK